MSLHAISKRQRRVRCLRQAGLAAAAAIGLLASCDAGAVTINTSQAVGSVPAIAGTGLSGSYYKFDVGIGSLSQADSLVAGASVPTATFTATTICYPSCNGVANDGTSLASYLGTNATGITGTSTLGEAVTRLTGYIAIKIRGDHIFSLGSDDGAKLDIGGTNVILYDQPRAFGTSTATVMFSSAGLYSFYVDMFENGGQTGLTVYEDGSPIPTAVLYSTIPVPEPATLSLLFSGLTAACVLRRRQRTA
jgi:hypothetical protein